MEIADPARMLTAITAENAFAPQCTNCEHLSTMPFEIGIRDTIIRTIQ